MGIDLHHFVNGIPALPPAVHLLIQQAEPVICFASGQAPQQGAKVNEAAESLKVIPGVAFHTVGQQAFDQTDRLKKVAMLDRIVDAGKTHLEELMAGIRNIGLPQAGPDLTRLVRHGLTVRIRLGGPLATTAPWANRNTRSQR